MDYDSKNLTAVIPSMFCSFNNIILGSIFSTYKKMLEIPAGWF